MTHHILLANLPSYECIYKCMIFHTKESVSPLTVHSRGAIFSDSYAKVREILINAKKQNAKNDEHH